MWSSEQKRLIVAETRLAGASVSLVARRHDVNANMIFTWRREFDRQECVPGAERATFVPALVSPASALPEPGTGIAPCARPSGRMEIVLGGGDRIIADKDVCAVALACVMRILRR